MSLLLNFSVCLHIVFATLTVQSVTIILRKAQILESDAGLFIPDLKFTDIICCDLDLFQTIYAQTG